MSKKPITHHFLTARERPPELIALRFKRHKTWLELNWPEYYQRSEAAALALRALDVKPGDRVAILSNTRWEWAALDFAIFGVGAITVPIYQSSRADEVEWILNHSGASALFVEDRAQLRKWEHAAKRCHSVRHVIVMQYEDALPESLIHWEDFLASGAKAAAAKPDAFAKSLRKTKLDDVATIVYTSGTTGEPKGAVLTHRQILAEVEGAAAMFPISSQDSTLSFLPYAHVLGRVELWLNTYVGFTLNLAENIDRLRQNLRETQPTALIGVPRIFEKIHSTLTTETQSNPWRKNAFAWLNRRKGPWQWGREIVLEHLLYRKLREGFGGRLRFAVSGGAPLEPKISEFFQRAGLLVLEGYGLTETTAAITANTPGAFRFGTVGRPFPGVEIKLAEDGEILVKGDLVMMGYYSDEAATAEAFRDGFFLTGDIGEWTSDGFLRITDRKKDLIKTAGGKYVAPQKLEGLLKLDPLISQVLIHGDRKKYIVALLTLDEGLARKIARERGWRFRDYRSLTQSNEMHEFVRQIVAQVNAQLASFETIKAFAILAHDFTIEGGELTPSLKVKRRVCDERYRDVIEGLYTS